MEYVSEQYIINELFSKSDFKKTLEYIKSNKRELTEYISSTSKNFTSGINDVNRIGRKIGKGLVNDINSKNDRKVSQSLDKASQLLDTLMDKLYTTIFKEIDEDAVQKDKGYTFIVSLKMMVIFMGIGAFFRGILFAMRFSRIGPIIEHYDRQLKHIITSISDECTMYYCIKYKISVGFLSGGIFIGKIGEILGTLFANKMDKNSNIPLPSLKYLIIDLGIQNFNIFIQKYFREHDRPEIGLIIAIFLRLSYITII